LQPDRLDAATDGRKGKSIMTGKKVLGPKPQKYTAVQKAILLSLGLGEDEGWQFHGDDVHPSRPSTWQEFCKRNYDERRKREAAADAAFLKACGIEASMEQQI